MSRTDRGGVATDEDVIRHFAEVVGVPENVRGPYTPKNPNHSPYWTWGTAGKKARVIMEQISPYLGSRRAGRALEVF